MASHSQQLIKSERRMFSSSDDSAMMKQIQATHSPDGRDVDVRPILHIIEDVMRRASPGTDGVMKSTHEDGHGHAAALVENAHLMPGIDEILESVAYIIHKISCELTCKCSGGADAHGTTMAILHMLSNYSWDAKVVISLAAFSVNYGEFWLLAQLMATNQLAKSVALLKQLPDMLEHAASLRSRFDAIDNLIKALVAVTKCIVEFKELPAHYISPDKPPMSTAMAHIPTAAYWTIRSMVACATQISSLFGMSYELITSTTEAWELSSMAHKIGNIHAHLMEQLRICHHYIDGKRQAEKYEMLVRLFETPHLDNMKILKALIYSKDDILPLLDGSTGTRVGIEVLRRKTVLLLISDLDISQEEIMILGQFHQEAKARPELQHYEIVWLPIVESSTHWDEGHQQRFQHLQSMMPWLMVHHPSIIEPAVVRYIREMWHFAKQLILVVLDPLGKVVCPNAHHMIWIWGNLAYPFTTIREDQLWKEETWRLDLLVDGIDPNILDWISRGDFICLYGGDDMDWIRKFTAKARAVVQAAGFNLQIVYVGKSSAKERVRNVTENIVNEGLSHCWPDQISVWYFWSRLESMLYSKMQHGGNVDSDLIMREVMTVLSFDGSDQGWAIFSKGLDITRSRGDVLLTSLEEFESWEEDARERGFLPALNDKLLALHKPQHCNRLILPGVNGGIPEKIVCAECGRQMEKYFMYRCCTD